jgi:phenylpropionate dioxygenase-like ring-hydroxylating dioxygenase large terminal subunit
MNVMTARSGREAASLGGGYHQSWYPLGLSAELTPGAVAGRDFLGSRVVLYRDPAGNAVVQSAWCPHLGADLSIGALIEGNIRCAYHHWRFGPDGRCVDIPTGDKIPPGAKVFTYPSAEAWGLIWAFNGAAPLFDVPRIPGVSESELAFEAHVRGPRDCDTWVAVSNGVDFQHLRTLHGIAAASLPETIEVEAYGIEFCVKSQYHMQHGRISGTSCFAQHLSIGSNEMFMLFCGAPIEHGKSMSYFVIGVRKPDGESEASREEVKARLAALHAYVDKLNDDDAPVLSTIRFRKGVLVAADRHLARYLKYVEAFPRAEPPDA